MEKQLKFGFIGAGNMAKAIIDGMVSSGLCKKECISVSDANNDLHNYYEEIEIFFTSDNLKIVQDSDVIFLSIKPQQASVVLSEISSAGISLQQKCFVTIMAGISTDYIKAQLLPTLDVIRVMPNTALMLKQGATAISIEACDNNEVIQSVTAIFKAMGTVDIIPESQMNVVISVNGSSPAYFYYFVDAMIQSAKSQGFDADTAKRMAAQTLIGCGHMLLEKDETPSELLQMVCSKGGTTIEAVNTLRDASVDKVIDAAMQACTKRAKELSL